MLHKSMYITHIPVPFKCRGPGWTKKWPKVCSWVAHFGPRQPARWRATIWSNVPIFGAVLMMYEADLTVSEKAWERFLVAERVALEERRRGGLDQALGGKPLPSEPPEELWWLAVEDRRLAEEGLVELRSGTEVRHKHIDDLTREDRLGRIEAESARAAWLMERLKKAAEGAQ